MPDSFINKFQPIELFRVKTREVVHTSSTAVAAFLQSMSSLKCAFNMSSGMSRVQYLWEEFGTVSNSACRESAKPKNFEFQLSPQSLPSLSQDVMQGLEDSYTVRRGLA